MESKHYDSLGYEMHQLYPDKMFMTVPLPSLIWYILIRSGWTRVNQEKGMVVLTKEFVKI